MNIILNMINEKTLQNTTLPFFKICVEHTKENEITKYGLNTQSKLNR